MKLRNFLTLIFVILALTPVLLFRAWPYSAVIENEYAEAQQRHLLLARNIAASLEHYHGDISAIFNLLTDDVTTWNDLPHIAEILENLHFRYICITDRTTGRVSASVTLKHIACPDVMPADVMTRLNAMATDGEIAFGQVVAGSDGENEMHLVRRIDGNRLAVGAIQTAHFRELGATLADGVDGHAMIVDHAGNVLYHPAPDWVTQRRNIADLGPVQTMLQGGSGVANFYAPALQADVIAGFAQVENAGWGVMIPQPVEEILARADIARQSAAFILLLGTAGSLLFALFISVITARPLEQMTIAAHRIAEGDLVVPHTSRWLSFVPFELRDLHQSFRKMVLQLRESTAQVNTLAFVDTVTGLANREYFRRRVTAFMDEADVEDDATLLFLDLDGFKSVNDTKGHDAGDIVLQLVAKRLNDILKLPPFADQQPDESKILKSLGDPVIARLGGDEFAIFLPNTGAAKAATIADQVLTALNAPFDLHTSHVALSSSIGVARFPEHAAEYSSLLKAADIAMYDAKRSGKNQVQNYFNDIPGRFDDRHRLADGLHSADFADQMDMFFQPIYRTDGMAFAGVEGLIRWHHPTEGLLAPNDFLSVAEGLGLERKIDKMTLQKSTDILSDLAMRGMDPINLSLNLSMDRLIDRPFMDSLIDCLPLPFDLSIELVESTQFDAVDSRIFWAVDRLREAGVAIELDDFGSTHASVSSLFDLAPRRIKLDSGLVGRMTDSKQIASIVKSIIDLAHNLNVEVVGKGVENMAQIALLAEMGCDFVQGYALNMPMTRDELTVALSQPKTADS